MSTKLKNTCEEAVYDELFRQHSKDVYQFLYYKFGEGNNATDIVQEAFLKLWENCKTVSPEKAKAYLLTVGNNLMLNQLARKKTALTFSKGEHRHFTEESPEYKMEESQFLDRINSALSQLSEEQRVTFMLNRVEGKKHKEIAEMLGISRKAVEKRIYKALSILRKHVENI